MSAGEGAPTSYSELARLLELLPDLVRERRRALQISQREAGRQIGVDSTAVHRWEAGSHRPDAAAAGAILRWLDTAAQTVFCTECNGTGHDPAWAGGCPRCAGTAVEPVPVTP